MAPLLCVAAAIGPADTCSAQLSASDEAGAEFERGTVAYRAGDYELALQLFRASAALFPHHATLFNQARCLEHLGQVADARRTMRDVLADPLLTEARRIDAEAYYASLERAVGRLHVLMRPALRTVRVDGISYTCAPDCVVEVDPGSHDVSWVASSSHAAQHRTVTVDAATVLEIEVVDSAGAADSTRDDRGSRTATEVPSPDLADSEERPPLLAGTTDPGGTDGTPRHTMVGTVGWAALVGAGVFTASLIGFALATQDRYDTFRAQGCTSASVCSEGVLFRDLTNTSLGLMAVAAVVLVVDILVDDL